MHPLRLVVGRGFAALSTVLLITACLQDLPEDPLDESATPVSTTVQELGVGSGLVASFSTGGTIVKRLDGNINFELHDARSGGGDFMGSGLTVGESDTATALWTGRFQVTSSATYVFTATTSDGVQLTIDGTTVIDDWTEGGVRTNEGSITLTPGTREFQFRTSLGADTEKAAAVLEWRAPGIGLAQQVVPISAFKPPLADPADNTGPAVTSHGPTLLSNTRSVIEINADEVSSVLVDYGLSTSYGSVASTGHVGVQHNVTLNTFLSNRTYYYRATVTDISNNSTVVTGTLDTPASAPVGGGLLGEFATSAGQSRRIDGTVDFGKHRARESEDFYGTGLDSSAIDRPTASWTGLLWAASTGTYGFSVTSDDGAKLTIDGQIVVFDWTTDGQRTTTGQMYMVSGWHAIDLHTFNFEYTQYAAATLSWIRPGASLEVIPRGNLQPSTYAGDSKLANVLAVGTPMVRATLATVEVLLNEPSRVYVDYGTTDSYGSTATLNISDVAHYVNITGLTGETKYHYSIRAVDNAGNTTTTADQTFTTTTPGEPGGWGPPPGTACFNEQWCADIGVVVGDACYRFPYTGWCDGCPRPACGASTGGCQQANNHCYNIGQMLGDGCRSTSIQPCCYYCGENCALGTFREPPGGSPEDPPPYGLLARFFNATGSRVTVVPNINYPSHSALTGNIYGSSLTQTAGTMAYAEFEGLLLVDETESITFATSTDDGVTLVIDGHVVIDDWSNGGARVNQGTVTLNEGWHALQMRTFNAEDTSTARAVLSWQSPSIPQAMVIPNDHFSPYAYSGDMTPPQILSVGPRLILDNQATIGVVTDEITTVVLEWGTTTGYGNTITVDALNLDHTIQITGLAPSTEYHYQVTVTDLAGNTTVSDDYSFTTETVEEASGNGGLLGTFTTSTGSDIRVDAQVDFAEHRARAGGDFFYTGMQTGTEMATATWTGMVNLELDEEYIFSVQSRDGVQLLIDSQTVILDWTDGPHWEAGSVDLEPGWHTIELRTYVAPTTETAEAILRWQSDSTPLEVVPEDHLTPASFPGDDQPPVIETLVARHITNTQATIHTTTNEVTTVVIEYGTSSLDVNTVTRIRQDVAHTYTLTGLTPATTYYYTAYATDLSGNTAVSDTLTFETTADPPPVVGTGGLWGRYETTLGVVEELVPQINFPLHDVDDSGPGDSFGSGLGPAMGALSAQWTGLILADDPDTYTFTMTSNDGVKLILDNRVIIGDWTDGGDRTHTAPVLLSAGWHPIQVHVFNSQNTPTAAAILEWQYTGTPKEVVPSDHLREDQPPQITSDVVSNITSSSARVTVTTNEITRAVLFWGETSGYGSEMESTTAATTHVYDLPGLTDDTVYHYTVRVVDIVGNQTDLGVDRTFRTDTDSTDPPEIRCPDHRLYDGASVSGLAPAMFLGDAAGLCWPDPVDGGTLASFNLYVIREGEDPVSLIDREWAPPRTLPIGPGCPNLIWCDGFGSQNLLITDATPEGPATLRYVAASEAGTVNTVEFPLIVLDLRAAIVRLLEALDAYDAGNLVNDAGAQSDLAEARLVYAHALDAYDAGHMPTVYAALSDMHSRALSVRSDFSERADYLDEIEMLLTEVNTAAVLWAESRIDSSPVPAEVSVQDRLSTAWDGRDVKQTVSNATLDAHWSLVRHEVVEEIRARNVEARIGESLPGRPDDARGLVDLVVTEANLIDDAITDSENMLGATEAVELLTAVQSLASRLNEYRLGQLNNHDIAEVIHDCFNLLTLLHNADQAHLGVDKLKYLTLLAIYSVVEQVIYNATLNICNGDSHPLIEEAQRRWNHLGDQLAEYEATHDEAFLAEFSTLVLGPDGTWNDAGPEGSNPLTAYPRVLCFIADVYDSAYTADADSQYYTEERLDIPGCDDSDPDWIPDCGL